MPNDRDILDLAGDDDSDILTLAEQAEPAPTEPEPTGGHDVSNVDRLIARTANLPAAEQARLTSAAYEVLTDADERRPWRQSLRSAAESLGMLPTYESGRSVRPRRQLPAWKALDILERDEKEAQRYYQENKGKLGFESAITAPFRGLAELSGRGPEVDPLAPEIREKYAGEMHGAGRVTESVLKVGGQLPLLNPALRGASAVAPIMGPSAVGYGLSAVQGGDLEENVKSAATFGLMGPLEKVIRGAKLPMIDLPVAEAGAAMVGAGIAARGAFGERTTPEQAGHEFITGGALKAAHAGEAKVRLAASGKADLAELFSEPRAAQAAEWKRAGVPDAEIARRLAEMPETVNAEGNVEGGYKPTAEVLANPQVPEIQKAAVREAVAQDVETFSSHVDPKTKQGVALGEQRETGEPRRVVVDPQESATPAPTEAQVPPREAGPKSETAGALTKRFKGKDWNVIETTADEATGKTRYVLEDPDSGARRTMLGPTSSKVPQQPPVAATTTPTAPKTPGSALLQAMTTPSVPEAASRMKEVVDSVRAVPGRVVKGFRTLGASIRDATTQFPTLTKENEPAAAAASRSASSVTISKAMGDLARERVREKHGVDSKRFGGALAEDNLRSERANRLKEAETLEAKGDAEGAALARKIAARIPTTIGGKDAAFKTEAEYQAYLKRPEVQAAIKEHVQFWEENKEPLYRIRQDIDPDAEIPSRGLQTGARINLFAVRDAEAVEPGEPRLEGGAAGSKEGNPKNVRVTRSPFSRRVVGSKNGYITDYDEMMANSFNREVEGAAKKQMVDELVKNGDALMGKPGLAKQMEVKLGQPVQEFPIKGGEFPRSIYVREGLGKEFRRAFKLDPAKEWGLLTAITKPINRASLTGLADNMVNMFRALKTPLARPQSANLPLETALNVVAWPAQVVRSFVRLGRNLTNLKGRTEQIARLAEAGAWRNYDGSPVRGLFSLVNAVGARLDQAARLSLSSVYDKMVAAGRVKDSPTARREFVNQMGNYQRAAQGAFIRGMTDSGLGPFTNAKATRWANVARALRLSPGLQAASPTQRWWMAMEMFSKMTGAFTTMMAANLATTGTPFGRDGVPAGSIDLGTDDEKGRPQHFGFLNISELGDIARIVGAQAYFTAKKRGLSEQDATQSAVTQMLGQILTFANTPVSNFASTAVSGKTITGWRLAPVASPEESQFVSNLTTAAVEMNPLVRLALIGWGRKILPSEVSDFLRLEDQEGRDVGTELETQMSYFAVKPGLAPQNVESLPDRLRFKRTAEYEEDLKRRITTVPIEKAQEWLTKQLEGLTPEEKARIGPRILRYAMRRK